MTGKVKGDWLGLTPQWCMVIFPNVTDLKVAARPTSRSCGKWLELLSGVVAAALHHPGPPPQLQGESWQGVRDPGDAWHGKHTGSFSLGHMGFWVPCWVLSTNLRRVCCVTFCHFHAHLPGEGGASPPGPLDPGIPTATAKPQRASPTRSHKARNVFTQNCPLYFPFKTWMQDTPSSLLEWRIR